MANLTPGKAFALSLLAFVVVILAVVLLWDVFGTTLAVIILIAAAVVIVWPLVYLLRKS